MENYDIPFPTPQDARKITSFLRFRKVVIDEIYRRGRFDTGKETWKYVFQHPDDAKKVMQEACERGWIVYYNEQSPWTLKIVDPSHNDIDDA